MVYNLPNTDHDLSGQVAIVTGASSVGLGRRFARVLAKSGAKVALVGRRLERLEELVEEIQAEGGQAFAVAADLANADTLTGIVEQTEKHFGLVSILVNNAAITDAQWATKMSLELINDVLNINLRAPYVLSCEVARRLIKAKQPGRIVNISSIGAYFYMSRGSSLYSTSKAAVIRMTETLAVEWASMNINVNAIAPGAFATEMVDGMIDRVGDDFIQAFPRKRLADPAQLDSTLLYLCSPASAAVTGTVIKVDDGQRPR